MRHLQWRAQHRGEASHAIPTATQAGTSQLETRNARTCSLTLPARCGPGTVRRSGSGSAAGNNAAPGSVSRHGRGSRNRNGTAVR